MHAEILPASKLEAMEVLPPGLSFLVSRQGRQRLSIDGRGLLGMGSLTSVAVGAIAAYIAIPQAQPTAQKGGAKGFDPAFEWEAEHHLRIEVFHGEAAFQSGKHHDRYHDGSGAYGFFREMVATPIFPGRTDMMIPHPLWNTDSPVIDGYRYTVYIPDGKGGAMCAADEHPITDVLANEGPDYVVYATPVDANHETRVLALTSREKVYAHAFRPGDSAPSWNALFGGKGWHDPIVWEAYKPWEPKAASKPQASPVPKPTGATDF